jgi:hypothetical protein
MFCCLLTALDRESCSSSSSSTVVSGARDFKVVLRHIFFSRPSCVLLVSCLRSHPRGILATGSEFGSSRAASVSSHVWLNDARVARLHGDATMMCTRHVKMPRNRECYIIRNTSTKRLSFEAVEWWVVRVAPLVGSGDHNKHAQAVTLFPIGPFPRLELFGAWH